MGVEGRKADHKSVDFFFFTPSLLPSAFLRLPVGVLELQANRSLIFHFQSSLDEGGLLQGK